MSDLTFEIVGKNVYACLECGDPTSAAWELNTSEDVGAITTEQRCSILEDVRESYGINLNDYQ